MLSGHRKREIISLKEGGKDTNDREIPKLSGIAELPGRKITIIKVSCCLQAASRS